MVFQRQQHRGASERSLVIRIGLGVGLLAAVLVVVALLAWGRERVTLWLYNGFDQPMLVVIDGDRFTLEPGRTVRAGPYPREPLALTATPQGWAGPLEQVEIDPGSVQGRRLLVNLAGRAALMRGWIRYGPGLVPEDELVGTAPLLAVDSVDHLLTPAPESKVLEDGGSDLDELIFDLESALPFSLAAYYTLEVGGPEQAWRMIRARLLEAPGDRDAFALACGIHPRRPSTGPCSLSIRARPCTTTWPVGWIRTRQPCDGPSSSTPSWRRHSTPWRGCWPPRESWARPSRPTRPTRSRAPRHSTRCFAAVSAC
jgi:hypothetical protein